jgi:hypothetical protein
MSLNFLFVQFEFTHAVGPHAARYLVTADGVPVTEPVNIGVEARNREVAGVSHGIGEADVLAVGVRGASSATASHWLLRRPRAAPAKSEPDAVPLALLTFIKGSEPLSDAVEAKRRLDVIRFSQPAQRDWVSRGLTAVNLAIRAHRISAPDPYAVGVTRRDPRSIRIGFGTTEQVQEGNYAGAIELPPAPTGRQSRYQRLRPAEAVAAVLTGRYRMFEAEDLLVRVLLDLDQGRTRGAAHQAAAAMRLLRQELYELADPDRPDLEALAEHSRRAHALAALADDGPLNPAGVAELGALVDDVAAVLDTWRSREDAVSEAQV